MPGKVRVISPRISEPVKHVVIYARVSSNSMEQLESLKAQISGLVGFVSGHNNWKLVDIHIDIASSKKGSARPAFHKMIEECRAGLTDIVVVKNISRLGRDTVEVLDAINTLKEADVRIIFRQEELDTLTVGSSLLISTIEACTQAENETRSANIKWGIKQRASNGSLGFYRRKCYGYDKGENGDLVINEEQAVIVRLIFDLYLGGKSILGIVKELKERGIGKQLLQYGFRTYGIREVTVNEQNQQAVGFYEYMGFETYKRSDLDEQGGSYPLLYMKCRDADSHC